MLRPKVASAIIEPVIFRALIVILLGVFWAVAADRNADKRPNIILAMADDQGWGDMGYMPHDAAQRMENGTLIGYKGIGHKIPETVTFADSPLIKGSDAKTDWPITTANIRRRYRMPTTLRLPPRLLKD